MLKSGEYISAIAKSLGILPEDCSDVPSFVAACFRMPSAWIRHAATKSLRKVEGAVLLIVGLLLSVTAANFASADVTNTWHFTNSAYTLSNPLQIEVLTNAPGYAQLVLQSQNKYYTTLSDYTNAFYRNLVALGYDSSLRLSGASGSYGPSGVFTSRILDGGGAGNIWKGIRARVENNAFITDSALIAYYRMDNDGWLDSVSGSYATASTNTMGFSYDAAIGDHSGSFDGTAEFINNSSPLPITSAFSISLWVKAGSLVGQVIYFPLSIGAGFTEVISIRIGGSWGSAGYTHDSIALVLNGQSGIASSEADTFNTLNDVGFWRHIVVTYDNAGSPKTHIYKDAIEVTMASQGASGNVGAHNILDIGQRVDNFFKWQGLIDDVAIWNRALSSSEVSRLYFGRYRDLQAFKMQIRSGLSEANVLTKSFVGPDGATNSYYLNEGITNTTADFNPLDRYVQYAVYLSANTNRTQTPYVNAVGLFGDQTVAFDNSSYDFSQGSFSTVTNDPATSPTPSLGLAKNVNGGYYTNGTYTSRALDAGSSLTWNNIAWNTPAELSSSLSGLVGLWHMNFGWGSDKGGFVATPAGGATFSSVAKFGSGAGLFDGSTASVGINIGTSGQSLDFWIKDSNLSDGVMEIVNAGGTAYVSLSNHVVTVSGNYGTTSKLYVNGDSACLKLLNGWNHVAIVFGKAQVVNGINLGVANGDYLEGMLDELALYNYTISLADINAHFTTGRRAVAGYAQAQVRYGDSLPLTNSFAGPGGSPAAYYANGSLLALPSNARFLQYRMFLTGDGDATPNVDSVTLNYGAGSTMVDDTQPEFVQGSFDASQTAWYGDDIQLLYHASVGPANINMAADALGFSLWHMDESTWTGGGSVVKDSKGSRTGSPYGGANTVPNAAVGAYCGSFSGSGSYVDLTTVDLPGDFSFSLWFNTSDTNRSVLASTDNAGATYLTLEMNGNGAAKALGKLTLKVYDGTTAYSVTAGRGGLNDGKWHNAVAIRGGSQVHLYIDGEREGTANVGAAYGGLGSKTMFVAARPLGVPDMFYNGLIDEVAIWSRALTEAEIGNNYAGGFKSQGTGEYISETVDANDQAIWQNISWIADGPYSKPLSAGDATLSAVWHMEESAGVISNAVGLNNGTVNGATYGAAGRFGTCLSFNGASSFVSVPNNAVLEPANLTVEAWINANDAVSRPIVDKSSGGANGYAIGLDAAGLPYFRVGATTCTGYIPVRVGKWTHIAGCFDTTSSRLRLYVDGDLAGITAPVAVSTASGQPLIVGRRAVAAFTYFSGRIDEVAIHRRALGGEEVFDHYRAGAVTLKMQTRSSVADPTFAGVNFIGPDTTTNTFFVDSTGSSLMGVMSLGRYLQYHAYFASENYRLTPKLSGVRVFVANYPTANPTVEPDTGNAIPFAGRLRGFRHTIVQGGPTANVRYQISGDSGATPTWFWWNGTAWASNAPSDYNFANPVAVIDANITNFFELFYPKNGGNFRFRSFLHSEGDYQIQVDKVEYVASAGRLVVTVPNGVEVGTKAWVVGTPQTIKWTTAGVVSTNLVIELYNQSGSNFVSTLASGIPNTSNYTVKISDNVGVNYRIKIRDAKDPSIWDMSDGDFALIQDFHITVPDGGEQWSIGQTNMVRWDSPGPAIYDLGSPVALWFSNDAGTNWFEIGRPVNAIGNNSYLWNTPSNDARLVSENAMMGVSIPDVSDPVTALFGDASDNTFMMAGIVVTYPSAGTGIKMGNPVDILWNAAGAGSTGVRIDLFNGVVWTNLSMNAPCVPGSNSFNTVLTAPNPTEGAKIKITANEHPAVWGVSSDFTLADINIITPVGGTPADRDHWQIGTTNYITWTAGGAGNTVDVEYSPNGTNWLPVVMGYVNSNSSGGTVITNKSPQWIVPGPPSSNASIRITSVSQPSLYAISLPFDMAGVQVVKPNGGEIWEFTSTNDVTWLFQGAGANIDIRLAYVDNPTTNEYELIQPNVNILSGRRPIVPSNVRRPTNFARIRVNSTSLPMYDASDNPYTIRGLSMTFPQSNAVYTMGMNVVTGLQWFSAATEDTSCKIYYSTDGSNFANLVLSPLNIDAGAGDNKQDWLVPRNVLPSETARLKVVAGAYYSLSSQFILRGIRVIQPAAGAMFDIGINKFVTWRAAGLQFSAKLAGSLSTTGVGGPYSTSGLTTNVPSANGSTSWFIDPNLVNPTTNAVIRLNVWTPTNDTDVTMYSDPFVLRGLKFVNPSTGTVMALGTSVSLSFLSAGMGNGAMASIYYSPDGVTFDTTRPVTNNMLIYDGLNTMTWSIENTSTLTRTPSTNAALKIVCGASSTVSLPFRMSGIKVTTPTRADIWAVSDLTNTIKWIGVDTGPNYNLSFTVWAGIFPLTVGTIATGVSGTSFDWSMVPAAIGSNVTITITDGTATGQSEKFEVVAAPSVRIISPAAGDFWKVTESNTIQWIQGGKMNNSFVLSYSTYPFSITNLLKVGSFTLTNNIFSYTWDPIPNALGQTRIIVTNALNASISDQFENFSIVGKFDIVPFSGDIYALSPVGITWVTRGDVAAVDLYYSTDPLRSTASWQKINTEGPYSANIGHNLPATPYSWTVANYKTNTMWVRVQDHAYSNQVFSADKSGPYDDTGPFEVKYYRIVWRVYDEVNTQQLNNISMQDNLGWSASDLTSPIVHEYPYGSWTVVFYRDLFFNLPILNWDAKPSRTNDVIMQRSMIAPEPHVLANFAYDIIARSFTIHSWLERNGQIMTTPSQCNVGIYKSDGTLIETITSTVPDGNGVFWSQWNVAATETRRGEIYSSTDVFFAKVEVKYSGVTYTAGLTLQLRLAAGEETVAAMDAIVRTATSNILAGVNVVGSNVVAFRGETGSSMSNLVALAQVTRAEVAAIGTNVLSITNSMIPALTMLTNEMVGILEPAITNLNSQITNLAPDMVSDLARILERSTVVTYGSTNRILYKTRKGYDPSMLRITVSNAVSGLRYSGNMTEIVPGIYEREIIADWGIGSWTVSCFDPRANDSIVLTVNDRSALDDLPPVLTALTNRMSSLEANINSIQTLVSGLGALTNQVTSMESEINHIQMMVGGLEPLTNRMTGLETAVGNLGTMTNQMIGLEKSVSNRMSSLETVVGNLGTLTNRMSSLETNINAVHTLVSGIKGTDLSGVMSSIDDVKASVQGVNGPQINAALSRLSSELGAVTDTSWKDSFFGQLARITEQLDSIGPNAAEAFKKARAAQTEAESASSLIQGLKTMLEQGKGDKVESTLNDVKRLLESARDNVKGAASSARIGDLYDSLYSMAAQMKKLAESRQFKMWTEPELEKPAAAEAAAKAPELLPEDSLKKLTKGFEDMQGSMLFLQKLIDEKRYEPVVQEELQGVAE